MEWFEPVEDGDFRRRYDPDNGPLISYTGRHGYRKRLDGLVWAAADLDATPAFSDDGPACDELSALADDLGVDVRFLGSLSCEELPTFYSTLDVSCFPSLVEIQGFVALEANARGMPVVGVNESTLESTTLNGVTGCRYEFGDLDGFRREIRRALAKYEELNARRPDRRDEVSVDRSIDRFIVLHDRLVSG